MTPQNRPQLDHHPGRPHTNATLDAASVEAVARRVVELIRSEGGSPIVRRLVDAATLAAELGVERSWVYAHRVELGAIQLGSGSKPRLRFDVEVAREVLARSAVSESHEPKSPASTGDLKRRRRKRMDRRPGLLPIRGSVIPLDEHGEHS
jgi:hypothetical protein